MNINEVIRSGNPYFSPIKNISTQLGEIEWRFPFLAQALLDFAQVLCKGIPTERMHKPRAVSANS